jgi:phytoene dehydrogenase-like protein
MGTTADTDVIIIGAGVAGLTAARVLKSGGKTIKIIEATDGVGGRVRTDEVDGFLLDRGFQVLLTGYPEAKHFLDYRSLNLQSFDPGALILNERGISEIGDPLRKPSQLFKTIYSSAGTFTDKLKMMGLKFRLTATSIDAIFAKRESTTLAYLKAAGFSEKIISQFFRPFLTGIFLEDQLQTSSRMFEYVFKLFSEEETAVPAKGMGMITKQLAAHLSHDELLLNEQVVQINDNQVATASGKTHIAKHILIATQATNLPAPFHQSTVAGHSATTLYFSADSAAYKKPIIALNASACKMVNNIAIMDQVSSHYAPAGKSLISVSLVPGDIRLLEENVLAEQAISDLKHWFPDAVHWKHLKTYDIPYALPNDSRVTNDILPSSLQLTEHCFICGDHLLNGSINGAMKSGRVTAEAMLSKLS